MIKVKDIELKFYLFKQIIQLYFKVSLDNKNKRTFYIFIYNIKVIQTIHLFCLQYKSNSNNPCVYIVYNKTLIMIQFSIYFM